MKREVRIIKIRNKYLVNQQIQGGSPSLPRGSNFIEEPVI